MDKFNESKESRAVSIPMVAHTAAFCFLFANLILSPWAFGSWERWWFWPSFALLLLAGLCSGIGALAETITSDENKPKISGYFRCSRKIVALGIAAVPFFIYALVRSLFPSDTGRPLVALASEFSLLLMFSPLLVAFVSFFSLTRRRIRILCVAIIVNIIIIGVYGAIMQLCASYKEGFPDLVLWCKTQWTYKGRAKGSFFCPNHFSAFLNLGICMLVALAFTPAVKWRDRIISASLALVLFGANFLTISRGGLASIFIGLAFGIPILAMRGRSVLIRVATPLVSLVVAIALVALVFNTDNVLAERMKGHSLYKVFFVKNENAKTAEPVAFGKRLHEAFWFGFDRGHYIGSAIRAWESNPWWGIGPGQHSDRWTEFAATYVDRNGDPVVRPVNGDYSMMRAPRLMNDGFHLIQVHSDWTQLLEEYGAIGLSLFLIPIGFLFALLYGNQTFTLLRKVETAETAETSDKADTGDNDDTTDTAGRRRHRARHRIRDELPWHSGERITPLELSLPLAGLLICIVYFIHSFGDFSLQMPSIVWVMSFILAAGVLTATRTHR